LDAEAYPAWSASRILTSPDHPTAARPRHPFVRCYTLVVRNRKKNLAGERNDLAANSDQALLPTWLEANGQPALELLLRAVIHRHAIPLIVADNDRTSQDASSGAETLLGVSPGKIAGRRLDNFVRPDFQPQLGQMWQAVLKTGEQSGTLAFITDDGTPRTVEYTARAEVLPSRHVLVLRDKQAAREPGTMEQAGTAAMAQNYALFLLNAEGRIATWHSGANRIFGYTAGEAVGRPESILYPAESGSTEASQDRLGKLASRDHSGDEGWQIRKDGSRFWANAITTALKDAGGRLQGFARVVRDFTERHERDETSRLRRAVLRTPLPLKAAIAGIVSGEFNQIPEANDAFLEIVGYDRDDLSARKLHWPALTPPDYLVVDDLAHEETLRFGACTPYEKELIRKDGSRVPVLVATAALKLVPFRWITFVQDLSARNLIESAVQEPAEGKEVFEEMVGSSTALRRVKGQLEVVAPTDATVLVLGETGTGKELVARAIHRISPRRNMPFVSLNCAAIPTGLLESELFGYERGAFTGALSQKIGRFEMANHGTLFLDEVGDIPLELQPKLLRALQEKSFERLGGTKTIPIDVRLVAATNRNLAQMMADKLFRADLFYRLKVFPITTPPLRERSDDIPMLTRHFIAKYARKMNKQIDRISSDIMRALVAWPWPGNIRELENFIERSVILSHGPSLRAPLHEIRPDKARAAGDETLEHMEREHILRVLRESDGVITAAASRLGIPRTTLNAMMRKLDISRRDF
jgi:formate hydrogenlyase transcriptional activator